MVQTGPEQRRDTLIGRLFEADFESLTAKLRAPDSQVIAVSFDEDQANDIKEALRNTAQLIGDVYYDPLTSQATKVVLRSISRAQQLELALETEDFWADTTVEELREERGIEAVDDPGARSWTRGLPHAPFALRRRASSRQAVLASASWTAARTRDVSVRSSSTVPAPAPLNSAALVVPVATPTKPAPWTAAASTSRTESPISTV